MLKKIRPFACIKKILETIDLSSNGLYGAITNLNTAKIAGKTNEEIRTLVVQLEAARKGGAL
jgi:hypothetical protein